MIDAHCHLEHMDAEEVIRHAKKAGMSAIVTSIADIKDREDVIALRKKHPDFVFACLGFHPEIMGKYNAGDIDDYIEFIRLNKRYISAVGEVGVDYNWVTKADDQLLSRNIFEKFIELSEELKLPLVIHSRNGRDNKEGNNEGIHDAIEILKKHRCKEVMMHCFSGNEVQLKTCLEEGWMISYATILVKSFKHQKLAKQTPLDQMVLETDSPWLDPDSKELTNRPWKIERSAEVLSTLINADKDEILRTTEKNARRFFRM